MSFTHTNIEGVFREPEVSNLYHVTVETGWRKDHLRKEDEVYPVWSPVPLYPHLTTTGLGRRTR